MIFMKNVSNATWGKPFGKVIASVVMMSMFLVLVSTTQVHAEDRKKSAPADITYVGTVNDKPVFQISLDNTTGEDLYLTLTDEYGNYIYSEVVKDAKYSRKIQLDNGDLADMKLKLTVRSKNTYQSQLFDVNTNVRTVRDVEVVKL
jgi:hypothetical protein